jgi:hypothetical protein
LAARTAKVVRRNSVGCFSSLGFFVLAALTAVSAEHIALPDVVVGWVVIIAGIGMVVVNVVWRSRRVELNYSLCLDCRARRGRWILGGAIGRCTIFALFFFANSGFLLLMFSWWVIAERFQPAAVMASKMVDQRVWLCGAREAVLEKFPPLEVVEVEKRDTSFEVRKPASAP